MSASFKPNCKKTLHNDAWPTTLSIRVNSSFTNTQPLAMLSATFYCHAECGYAESIIVSVTLSLKNKK